MAGVAPSLTYQLLSLVHRADGWLNAVTGLGTDRDKSRAWRFAARGVQHPDDATLAMAYAEDDVVARVAGAIPAAAVGRGFRLASPTEDEAESLREALVAPERDVVGVIHEALVWEQLFGGSAILLGTIDPGSLDEPLDRRAVRGLPLLLSLDPREVRPDPGSYSASVDTADRYVVTVGGWRRTVHRSRLLLFRGLPLPRAERRQLAGWGASRVRRSWGPIMQFGAAWASVAHGLSEASISTYRLRDLHHAIAASGEDALRRRVDLVQYARSAINAVIIGDGEEWSQAERSFAGLGAVLDQYARRLAISTGIPLDIWIGEAPASLGNGDTSLALWYDQIGDDGNRRFGPALRSIGQLIAAEIRAGGGRVPGDWRVELAPLRRSTPREETEVAAIKVKTLQEAVAAGLVPAEVAARRVAEILDVDAAATTAGSGLLADPAAVAARLGRVGKDDDGEARLAEWEQDRTVRTSVPVD